MDKTTISIAVIALLSLIGVIGDFAIKLAGAGPEAIKLRWFMAGLLLYAATAFGWFYVMKNIKLSVLGVFYAIFTVLFLIVVGVFYFKESLNYYEIMGVGMAITSLVLLARFA